MYTDSLWLPTSWCAIFPWIQHVIAQLCYYSVFYVHMSILTRHNQCNLIHSSKQSSLEILQTQHFQWKRLQCKQSVISFKQYLKRMSIFPQKRSILLRAPGERSFSARLLKLATFCSRRNSLERFQFPFYFKVSLLWGFQAMVKEKIGLKADQKA